jgi:hypothetical protein
VTSTLSFGHLVAPAVVLVDGLTRSGKSLLGPILSSFERVEIERMEPDLEWIGDMWHLQKIERDAAVTFLRLAVNRLFYEGLIARNTNFRFGDHSSVWRSPARWRYFKRLIVGERLPLAERVGRERPIFQNMVHHQLMNFSLYEDAFGDRLRMVEMIRDPVDLIDSWMRKRKGELIGSDPLISMVFVRWDRRDLPWYASGWEEQYLASTPLDRVVLLIARKWRLSIDTFRVLTPSQREHLFLVPLEDFVQRPDAYVTGLGAFIGARPTRQTRGALSSQRCPRRYDHGARAARLAQLRAQAGHAAVQALDQMVDEHVAVSREITR